MPSYISGLDLGQSLDHSAMVVLEQGTVPNPDRSGETLNRWDVRHIHRWQLGTPYPAVIAELQGWYALKPLRGTALVVDRTGVGRGICDMIATSGLPADVRPYSITFGSKPGDGTVPKADLVAAVQSALQQRRLRFAESMPLRAVLEKELETFRVKVTGDRNETFAAWRESDHDDLVLALALALWYGERACGSAPLAVRPATPRVPAYLGAPAPLRRR